MSRTVARALVVLACSLGLSRVAWIDCRQSGGRPSLRTVSRWLTVPGWSASHHRHLALRPSTGDGGHPRSAHPSR